MVIDKTNCRQVIKMGLKFRINYDSIRLLRLCMPVVWAAQKNCICTVIAINGDDITYRWDKALVKSITSNMDRFFSGGMIWMTISDSENNKGLKECFKCGCRTEQRRDFKDFTIREFCPRCKV